MLKRKVLIIVLLLIISLLKTTCCISQTISTRIINNDTIVCITPQQLKIVNTIFNEHESLKLETTLLQAQVNRYEQIYQDELKIDSLYEATTSQLEETIHIYKNQILEQETKIKRSKFELKCWRSGGTIVILLLIWLL